MLITISTARIGPFNRAGQTPLRLASQEGEVDIGTFIERGADLTAQNK